MEIALLIAQKRNAIENNETAELNLLGDTVKIWMNKEMQYVVNVYTRGVLRVTVKYDDYKALGLDIAELYSLS